MLRPSSRLRELLRVFRLETDTNQRDLKMNELINNLHDATFAIRKAVREAYSSELTEDALTYGLDLARWAIEVEARREAKAVASEYPENASSYDDVSDYVHENANGSGLVIYNRNAMAIDLIATDADRDEFDELGGKESDSPDSMLAYCVLARLIGEAIEALEYVATVHLVDICAPDFLTDHRNMVGVSIAEAAFWDDHVGDAAVALRSSIRCELDSRELTETQWSAVDDALDEHDSVNTAVAIRAAWNVYLAEAEAAGVSREDALRDSDVQAWFRVSVDVAEASE